MMKRAGLPVVLSVLVLVSGCAGYRTISNIDLDADRTLESESSVIIAEDSLPGREYEELGPIEVSLRKPALFFRNPRKEEAHEELEKRARVMGADAVIDVTYRRGIGATTWGYLDASGVAVRLLDGQ